MSPFGVNANGDVSGYFRNAALVHGFVQSGGTGSTVDFPGIPAATFAQGLNDQGQVTGYYIDVDGGSHGFVDTLSSTAVSEPSSLLLVGSGLLAMTALRRRGRGASVKA